MKSYYSHGVDLPPSYSPAAVGNAYEIPSGVACPDQGGHQASAEAGDKDRLTSPFHGARNEMERCGTFHHIFSLKRSSGAALRPFRSAAFRVFWEGVERYGTNIAQRQ